MKLIHQHKSRFPKGFTLIELLVVVLIIGILAAVALPQYQKAVKKAEAAEAHVAIDALNKGISAYYLENGTYEGMSVDNLGVTMPELKHFKYNVGTQCVDRNPASATFDPQSIIPAQVTNDRVAFAICGPDYGIQLTFRNGEMKTSGDKNLELYCKYFVNGKFVPAEHPWESPSCL